MMRNIIIAVLLLIGSPCLAQTRSISAENEEAIFEKVRDDKERAWNKAHPPPDRWAVYYKVYVPGFFVPPGIIVFRSMHKVRQFKKRFRGLIYDLSVVTLYNPK
jgi:hypothetical protein